MYKFKVLKDCIVIIKNNVIVESFDLSEMSLALKAFDNYQKQQ